MASQAPGDVIFAGHSFAHVVKQQRKEKQLRLLQFGKKIREWPLPISLRRPQTVDIFDGHEGMRVHGVVMVVIAHHQRIDGAKLREQPHQQPRAMHGAQRFGRVRGQQNLAKIAPQCRGIPRRFESAGQRLANLVLGLAAELHALAWRRIGKHPSAAAAREDSPDRAHSGARPLRKIPGARGAISILAGGPAAWKARAALRPATACTARRPLERAGNRCASTPRAPGRGGFQRQSRAPRRPPAAHRRARCRRGPWRKCRKQRAAARKSKAASISLRAFAGQASSRVAHLPVFCILDMSPTHHATW